MFYSKVGPTGKVFKNIDGETAVSQSQCISEDPLMKGEAKFLQWQGSQPCGSTSISLEHAP